MKSNKRKVSKFFITVFSLLLIFTALAQFKPFALSVNAAPTTGSVSLSKLRGTLSIPSIGRPASEGLWGFKISGTRAFCLNTGKSMNSGDTAKAKTYNAVRYSNKSIAKALTYYNKKMSSSTFDIGLMQAYIWACGKGTSKSTAVYEAGHYMNSGYSRSDAQKFCNAISDTDPEGKIYYYKITKCRAGKSLSGHQVLLAWESWEPHIEKEKLEVSDQQEDSENLSVTIEKKDQETGGLLSGAVFSVACDGNTLGTVTTQNGLAVYNYNRRLVSKTYSSKKTYVKNWKELNKKQQKECTKKGWFQSKSKAKSAAKKEIKQKTKADIAAQKKASHTWTVTEIAPPDRHAITSGPQTKTESGSKTSFSFSFSNPEQKLNLTLKKTSTTSDIGYEATLAGAVYQIKAAEPIKNSMNQVIYNTNAVVGNMVTNSSGQATYNNLHAGKYYVVEAQAPKGFILDTTRYYVDGTTTNNRQISISKTITVPEKPIQKKIKIQKSKGDASTPEQGAKFNIIDSANKVVDVIITDANGYGESKLLPYGSYTIRQVEGAPGYIFSPDYTVRIDNANQSDPNLKITNQQENPNRFRIVKNKKIDDPETNTYKVEPEKNARFEVLDKKGAIIASMYTDKNGYAESPDLDYGTYTVRQTAGADGYAFVDDFTVTIDENTIETQEFILDNPFIGDKIAIKKTKSRNGEITPEEGAGFAILDASKLTKELTDADLTDSETRTAFVDSQEKALIATVYTNENGTTGMVLEDFEMPEEGLILLQTSGLEGYELCKPFYTKDKEPVIENGLTTYRFEADDPYTEWAQVSLKKTKVISRNKSEPVLGPEANAEFAIYDYENEYVTSMFTDENGYAESPRLDYGSYTLRQVSGSPSHQFMEDIDFYLTKQERHQVFSLGDFTNEEKDVEFKITKKSSETSILLDGGAYEIYDYSGDTIATVVTGLEGDKGTASVELPYGTYKVKEIQAPDGYQLDKEIHEFVLDVNGVSYDEKGNGSYNLELTDTPIYGEIEINKTGNVLTSFSQEEQAFKYENGPVAGATYALYAKEDILKDDGSIVYPAGTKIDEKTTGDDGTVKFTRKLADGTDTTDLYLGTYYVQEISAPPGFTLDQTQHEVVLTWDSTAGDVNTFEPNEPIPDVEPPFGNWEDAESTGPAVLCKGKELNEILKEYEETTDDIYSITFTYYDASDRDGWDIDVSEAKNRSIMLKFDGNDVYIRTTALGKVIRFNASSSYMFSGLSELTDIYFDNVDTTDVVDMSYMFQKCITMEELDLTSFNTKNVQNMARMFYDDRSLEKIYVNDARFTKVPEDYVEPEIVEMKVEPKHDFTVGDVLTIDDFTFTAIYADDSEEEVMVLEDEATFKPKKAYAPGTLPVEAHMAGRYAKFNILNTEIEVIDDGEEVETSISEKPVYTLELNDTAQTISVSAIKKNGDKTKKLEGAEFAIRAAVDIVNASGDLLFSKGDIIGREVSQGAGSTGQDFEGISFGGLPTNAYAKDGSTGAMYELIETKPPKGYKLSTEVFQISGNPSDNTTVEFSHDTEVANELSEYISIWKDWTGFKDEQIPDSIEVTATNRGTGEKRVYTLTRENDWWTETDILKKEMDSWNFEETKVTPEPEGITIDVKIIKYSVDDPYAPGIVQIENKIPNPDKVQLKVIKRWSDGGNRDKLRPTSIKVKLYSDGEYLRTVTLDANNRWTYETEELDKFDSAGNVISYTWEEVTGGVITGDSSTGYKPSVSIPEEEDEEGFITTILTNTYDTSTTSVSVVKKWDDDTDKDKIRPIQVKVNLKRNDEVIRIVTLCEDNEWKFTVNDLTKNDENGNAYKYTWEEVETDVIKDSNDLGDVGYKPIYKTEVVNGVAQTTITNYHEMPLGSVDVTKRLDPTRLDFTNGNPTFTFILEGTDVYGNEVKQEKSITFSQVDQSGSKDSEGYVNKKVTFDNLRYGSYKLYEKDPVDYLYYLDHVDVKYNAELENGLEVVIDHQEYKEEIDGDKNSYNSWKADAVFTNEPLRGSIKLIKQDSGEPLQGVEFRIETENGVEVATKTTDANGEIYVDKLKPGTYVVTETNTLKGYNLLTEPFKITIPYEISSEDVEKNNVDVTDAIYKIATDTYAFYDLTYTVENDATLELPDTGSFMDYLVYVPIILAAVIFTTGGILWNHKRKAK